jgi:hypothetical protein
MTPSDLADIFRSDVDDTDEVDPLWTDIEVFSYMDRSQKMFARRTDYFADASTAEIVTVDVTADEAFVDLDPRITKIRGARLASNGRKIEFKKYDDVEHSGYQGNRDYSDYGYHRFSGFNQVNWEIVKGAPTVAITDLEKDRIRLVPIPIDDDTINLHVYRLPLADITCDNDAVFEIDELEYQTGLIYYMKFLAYQKNDADVFNTDLATLAGDLADTFMHDARDSLRRQRFSPTLGVVRYAGL